jgi:hypothetical protein
MGFLSDLCTEHFTRLLCGCRLQKVYKQCFVRSFPKGKSCTFSVDLQKVGFSPDFLPLNFRFVPFRGLRVRILNVTSYAIPLSSPPPLSLACDFDSVQKFHSHQKCASVIPAKAASLWYTTRLLFPSILTQYTDPPRSAYVDTFIPRIESDSNRLVQMSREDFSLRHHGQTRFSGLPSLPTHDTFREFPPGCSPRSVHQRD